MSIGRNRAEERDSREGVIGFLGRAGLFGLSIHDGGVAAVKVGGAKNV